MSKSHSQLICNVSELSGLFTNADSLENFLKQIVFMISEHMQTEVCSIYLFYEEQQQLVLKATRGLDQDSIGNVKLKIGEGLAGLALKEMRPICVGEASKNPQYRFFPNIGEERYSSFLAVPIVRGHTRIGVMVLQNAKKNYFKDEDVQIFKAITSQLANTIETAKLLMTFEEEHKGQKNPYVTKLKFIKGRVGAQGFAYAPGLVLDYNQSILEYAVSLKDYPYTLDDFYKAIHKTERYLEDLQGKIEDKLSDVASLIFTAHILMLKDQLFIQDIVDQVGDDTSLVDAIVYTVQKYSQKFEQLSNPYLREKRQDLEDVAKILLKNLKHQPEENVHYSDYIVIARELYSSDILKLALQNIKGIVLLSGGMTSHLSILARSLKIPLIISDDARLLSLAPQTQLLLDAYQGNIYINPNKEIVQLFREKQAAEKKEIKKIKSVLERTLTKDLCPVKLLSNINLLNDVDNAVLYKAEGIGLYRTEFPFMIRSNFPSEEEQFVIYQKLTQSMPGREITFRTLDIGGDKVLSYYDYGKEKNPFLGMRSIRFSLKHKDIFFQQLRAILRAGRDADLKILFPMISSVDEFLEAKQSVLKCVDALSQEGVDCHKSPQIGVMIELPSVMEIIEELTQEADFLSIGTNDFIQYMLAVDRTNEKVADLYLPYHPAVLRALAKVVTVGKKCHKEVCICGDMAHDERFIVFFLGVGVRCLSLESSYIPKMQKIIGNIDTQHASQIAQKILAQKSLLGIKNIIQKL